MEIKMNNKIVWDNVDWHGVHKRVSRYQQRIYRASLSCNIDKVRMIQNLLIRSMDAKLLAVRRVTTENIGKKTAGIDNRLYLTSKDKAILVNKLRIDGKASPIRKVWIPKPYKGEKRALGIPVIRDRAKQALVKLALEPEWEAKFEPNSYGFRPGRSCHDAMEAIFNAIRTRGITPGYDKYVLDADLKGCFDNIDHDYLLGKLNTIPIIRNQVKAWLKAGILEGFYLPEEDFGTLPENQMGTPPFARSAKAREGGVISPFLANVALHEMENHLKQWVTQFKKVTKFGGSSNKSKSLSIVRYADDFVLIHPSHDILVAAKEEITNWLKSTSKVSLNEHKTQIKAVRQGFDFLGWSFITVKRNGIPRTKITPSRNSQNKLLSKVRFIIQNNKAISAYALIPKLRPIIIGWANYHRYSECNQTFRKINHQIFNKIRAWVYRRDRRNNRYEITNRYFSGNKPIVFKGVIYNDKWVLIGKQTKKNGEVSENFLPHISWIQSAKFVKIQNTRTPYDGDLQYWWRRTLDFGGYTNTQIKLIKQQKMLCTYCENTFHPFDRVEIDHNVAKSKGGSDRLKNLQVLHKHCHIRKSKEDKHGFIIKEEPDEVKVSRPSSVDEVEQ
jgi:RNA-directed DNA polymerase